MLTSPLEHGRHEAQAQWQETFNVCHIGVVLRAVLGIEAIVGLSLTFVAREPFTWFVQMAACTAIVLPALLFWLILSCQLKNWLVRLPPWGQLLTAGTLGAFSAGLAWGAGQFSRLEMLAPQPLWPSLWAGAAFGWALAVWLHMRAGGLRPALDAARLFQLQACIRPHFLFNTLNTALCLVRIDPVRAEQVLEHLAELFRHTLDDQRVSVTLAEELDLARRYLDIEQIRFGDRLKIRWDLNPAANSAKLPPLLLQPLVENAVRHGVEPCPQGGMVYIQTSVRRGMARIIISNSVASPSRPGHGIALRNVRERLHLMHDVAAHFEVKRQPTEYCVRMEVPL